MPIKSRWTTQVNNNYYTTLTLSGSTLIGHKGIEQGYIFLPYILTQSTPIIVESPWSRDMYRRILRNERREKLNKLGW